MDRDSVGYRVKDHARLDTLVRLIVLLQLLQQEL